jgi:hypothetical protein
MLALRELGRAMRINDQFDKLESTHQFARVMVYGQNGQFHYAGKKG